MFRSVLVFIFFINGFSQKAFETLSFEIAINSKSFSTEFNNYYKQNNGISFRVLTPYYYGDFYAGVKQIKFTTKVIDDTFNPTDFNALFIYIAWQIPLIDLDKFRTNIGLQLGSFEMEFTRENRWYYASESELSTAVELNLLVEIMPEVKVTLASEHQYVYTYKRIKIHTINVGLSYQFEMPPWLKDFLQ